MDNSVTIIGLIILMIALVPIFFMIRSQSLNKGKIKAIFAQHSNNNHFNFVLTESQNKKVLAIDEKNKGFILIDFNFIPEEVTFIDLTTVASCKLIPTTENSSSSIVKIEFEFEYKTGTKKQYVPFYTIENDQIGQVRLYEDHQLAKKWAKILQDCISA